jgi:BASS family bile acid:Na+ symporter
VLAADSSLTAAKLFDGIFNASLVVMLLTLVASLGMTFSVGQIIAPLRRFGLLVSVVVFNSLLAPLIAIGICHLFPISSQGRVGLELATIAAAGPAVLKGAQLSKGSDLAMAVSFTVVLQLVNIIVAPLWAKAVVTGATVNPWSVVFDLLILVLAPLAVGLFLRRYEEHREAWKAGLEKTSNIALFVVFGVGIGVNWHSIVTSFGSWVILASVIITILYFVLGYVIAFYDRQAALTSACLAALRFSPIGMVVIATVLKNQSAYLTPALLYGLVATVLGLGIPAEIGHRLAHKRAAATQATVTLPDTPQPAHAPATVPHAAG